MACRLQGRPVLWFVGLVDAFILIDNLDGACSTVAAVAAAGSGLWPRASGGIGGDAGGAGG
jgi:hypothetical protein